MKKILILLAVATALLGTSTFAQGGKKNMQELKQQVKDSLNLSDAQVDSVVAIVQEFQPQIKSIMKDQSLSKDQKKEKVKPVRQEMISRLKGFLSEEQLRKLQEMIQDKRQKNAGMSG